MFAKEKFDDEFHDRKDTSRSKSADIDRRLTKNQLEEPTDHCSKEYGQYYDGKEDRETDVACLIRFCR